MGFDLKYKNQHELRFRRTLDFITKHIKPPVRVLDLGPKNPMAVEMEGIGFEVENTFEGQDLDLEYEIVKKDFDVITAFEIFEHMVSPFPLLKQAKAKKLFASVPLKLWFSDAYWNENDPFDCHFHEFESRQFDMLLKKAGWKIIDSQKWITPNYKLGIRPILRNFTPRHYIVYCKRG